MKRRAELKLSGLAAAALSLSVSLALVFPSHAFAQQRRPARRAPAGSAPAVAGQPALNLTAARNSSAN